jgi:4-amino-4-deoxy-L-arabinose transferase-like glycosyltransferase
MNKALLNRKNFYILAVLLVFAAGLAIRFYDLTNPPLDFNPVRQIHSAIIARGFYVFLPNSHLSGLERDKAWSFSSELWIEPPILEYVTAWTYVLAGDVYLWIARIYSIVFWTLGGWALFKLMNRLSGQAGALAALIYYLFLPFGILASRSFQPDPLMVSLLIFSFWALLRWQTSPSWKNAILAGVLCGMAILVKQVAVFFIAGGMAAVFLSELGLKRSLLSLKVWCMGLLALLPAVSYNIYGLFISGFLKTQYSLRFFPNLFIDPLFYYRWISKINLTTGWIPVLLAVSGILFLSERPKKWFLVGLFSGYLFYGLGFAYHISTHDYYQEPLIPLTAIGIGVVFEALISKLDLSSNKWRLAFLTLVVMGGSLFTLWNLRNEMKRDDYRDQPALWKRLGREFNYGIPAVVGLFDDYGVRLMYWGMTMPAVWESSGDVYMRELAGQQQAQKDILTRLAGKRFFIVTDFEELDNQPDLKKALSTFPVYERGNGYIIYDIDPPGSSGQKP